MNIENLTRLADYVEKNVTDSMFSMECFRKGFVEVEDNNDNHLKLKDFKNMRSCGTVGCLLGWAPFAHIDFKPLDVDCYPNGDFSWLKYGERVFDINSQEDIWDFLFAGAWVDADNTVKGGVDRIRYICKNPNEEMVNIEPDNDEYNSLVIPENYPLPDGWQ